MTEKNPYLVQALFRYSKEISRDCPTLLHAIKHEQVPAVWIVNFFQDINLVVSLARLEVNREIIDRTSWEKTANEQDTTGITTYTTFHLCADCASRLIQRHGGKETSLLAISTAQVTHGALLLVWKRDNGVPTIVGNVPGEITVEEILPFLRGGETLVISFNPDRK